MGRKNRKKLHEVDLNNDIRYRGPLSYREFRILGWICLALSQVALLLSILINNAPETADSLDVLYTAVSAIATLSLPFLLMANFSIIIDNKNGYKKQIIIYSCASAAFIFFFMLFCYRYISAVFTLFTEEGESPVAAMEAFFQSVSVKGYIAFNIFIDLLLCTLIMLFLNYKPKRFFTGKKLIIFRLLALLPVFYEIGAIILKILTVKKIVVLPLIAFPLLPVKPPITFIVFIVLALYIKNREKRFCKYGRTHSEYQAFLKTNRNSLNFSIFSAIILASAGVIDILITFFIALYQVAHGQELTVLLNTQISIISNALGFGRSVSLIPMAPIMLLFSYTRMKENKYIDYLIPAFGIVLIIFIYLEAIHAGIRYLPTALENLFNL